MAAAIVMRGNPRRARDKMVTKAPRQDGTSRVSVESESVGNLWTLGGYRIAQSRHRVYAWETIVTSKIATPGSSATYLQQEPPSDKKANRLAPRPAR